MTPPAARRIAKTLSLLASAQDGEALAAARALSRLLEGAGMDLHGLAALVAGEMERRAAPAFTFATLPARHARKQMGFMAWRPGTTEIERARLEILRARLLKKDRLGRVDSWDSRRRRDVIQGCLSGGGVGRLGSFGAERHGVGADGAADHRPA